MKRKLLNIFFRFLNKRLRDKYAIALFDLLAGRFGIEEVVVTSKVGKVQGKLDDRGVFFPFLLEKDWASNFTEFLVRSFKAHGGGTFIDIGANIGLVTIPIARLGSVDCKCFEPEPENFALLKSNVARNRVDESCELFPVALYSEESTVDFEIAKDNRGDHRIRIEQSGALLDQYKEGDRTVVQVPARPLDELLPQGSVRDFVAIKCDIQGAELGAYLGGRNTFRNANALWMEFWPYGLRRMGSDPGKICEMVARDFDFGLPVLGDERIETSKFVSIQTLADRLRAFTEETETIEHLDFIAVKKDLLEKLA